MNYFKSCNSFKFICPVPVISCLQTAGEDLNDIYTQASAAAISVFQDVTLKSLDWQF